MDSGKSRYKLLYQNMVQFANVIQIERADVEIHYIDWVINACDSAYGTNSNRIATLCVRFFITYCIQTYKFVLPFYLYQI